MASYYAGTEYCEQIFGPAGYYAYSSIPGRYVNLTNLDANSLASICDNLQSVTAESEYASAIEDEYNAPMVLIGIYISIASLVCILAMSLDLFNGFRNRKFWFPTRYFSLNAASITVIAVAMKLPVDLTSRMPSRLDQVAKVGSLAFMCTMMSNLMPSLASMDNNSLLANAIASKKILESKYQATSKTTLNDQHPEINLIPTVEELRQLVKRYWIMTETGSPQFVTASNPLSVASGIVCLIGMLIYITVMWGFIVWPLISTRLIFLIYLPNSVYKWSIIAIDITQSIGIVVGSIAPIFRCFTLLSFKSFANQNRKHFLVFKVEKYWTQKLCEWKESRISFLSSGRRSRVLLHNMKNRILSFSIGFQKVIVVSCKIIGLLPIVVIICIVYCSYYFKSLKAKLFTPPTASSSDNTNEDVSNYVLLLEENTQLAEKTMKGISDSMNRLIKKAEKKQHKNLLKLLEKSVVFKGVESFDTDQIQSLLPVELVNSWSLPVISLTCIAISIPNIHKDRVDNLFESVGEGLLYTHLVEESLNKASEHVKIRRATVSMWHEVEDKRKWLDKSLERSAFKGKNPTEIIESFANKAKETVNEFSTSTNGELVEENLPPKVIAANSMYRIAQTIIHTYENNNSEITEDELFTRLSGIIADILAACLTNIPRVITMRCQESAIEKREASVMAAIDLLGRTTEMIKRLETRVLPKMDPDKIGFIDEWRLHLKQP